MIRLVSAGLFLALSAFCQMLTVTPSAIPDVEVIGPQSPDFQALVTQIVGDERPLGLAVALPYGVVIRNHAPYSITAVDTVWTAADRVLLDAADSLLRNPALYIRPGQAALVVPPGIFESPRQLRIFADGTTRYHRLENFLNSTSATVTVDSVVFDSGQFVGADRYYAFEQWQAQIQAPRDLAAIVLEKQSRQSIGEIVSWLEGLARTRPLPSDQRALSTISAAMELVAAYRQKGEAELFARAASRVNSPAFPLHR
jgi:hypothetical protein